MFIACSAAKIAYFTLFKSHSILTVSQFAHSATESEDLAELDRFVEAMLAIRREIDEVAAGTWPLEDSPLRNAPHTAAAVTADEWTHPYAREVAAFPVPGLRDDKYWPPVRRIDGAYGDRHLVCSCPPVEAFTEAAR